MQRSEVDGVPVFWDEGPPPLSAGLVFRVGRRDEDFANGGITHLVEHLVMETLPPSHLDCNAHVGNGVTEFTATGRPEAVADFLERVCRGITALPLDRVAVEASVLQAEEARGGGSLLGALLLQRYGATDLGLLGMIEPQVDRLTAEQAQAHAARYLHRGNAALWLSGPPPDGLHLPLPDGPPPPPRRPRRIPLPLPAVTEHGGSDVGIAFELPDGPGMLTSLRLLERRAREELRRARGRTYHTDFRVQMVEHGTAHVLLTADAVPEHAGEVAAGLHAVLTGLARDGATDEELAHEREGLREFLDDPRSVLGAVESAARAHLAGEHWQDEDELVAELDTLTGADVAAALRPALDCLILAVPAGVDPGVPGLTPVSEWSTDRVEGRAHKRRLRGDFPRGSSLVLGAEGLTLVLPEDRLVTVRYADAVALGVADGASHQHLEIVGVDGATAIVCEEDWRDGSQVVAEVLAATAHLPRYVVARTDGPGGDR